MRGAKESLVNMINDLSPPQRLQGSLRAEASAEQNECRRKSCACIHPGQWFRPNPNEPLRRREINDSFYDLK